MRRDWKAIANLLDAIEQLAGHPNLRQLRDEANEDLMSLLEKPVVKKGPPAVGPADMAGATPIGATGPTEVHPLGSGLTGTTGSTGHYMEPELEPGEHTQDSIDHNQSPNVSPNPELSDNISDPIVRRRL